jgi:hypothetical protein
MRWGREAIPAKSLALLVSGLVASLARPAFAQGLDAPPGEFSLGIGYAHLGIGGSDSVLDSEDALRFDSALMYSFFPDLPQLRLGFGFGVTLVLDDSERIIISDGGLTFIGSSDVPLYLLEPEFRVSWQQYLGADQMFFIEPGIGVGGVFGNLNIDAEDTASGESFDEWDSSFSARVFLNVGFLVEGGVAGVQASYMWAESLDFAENAGGEVEEFYIGVYGALQF